MNAGGFAKCSMHCCHFVPIWRDEVSSAAQKEGREFKWIRHLAQGRAFRKWGSRCLLLASPASTQGPGKQKEGSGNCVRSGSC